MIAPYTGYDRTDSDTIISSVPTVFDQHIFRLAQLCAKTIRYTGAVINTLVAIANDAQLLLNALMYTCTQRTM